MMLPRNLLPSSLPYTRWLVLVLVLLGSVSTVYGLISEPIYSKELTKANLEILGWVLLCLLPCLAYGYWRGRVFSSTDTSVLHTTFQCLCGITLLAYVQALGFAVSLSVGLIGLASFALGGRIYRLIHPGADALRVLLGLACISALIGWSLALPIHRPGIYFLSLASLCVWRRAALRDALQRVWSNCSEKKALPSTHAWAKLGLLMLFSIGALPTWLPSVMTDDLTYHLGMSYELAENARYRFDISSQIWAVAPWGSDTIYAMAHVLAGDQARGGVNVLLQLLLLFLLDGLLIRYGVQSLLWRSVGIALAISQPVWVSLGLGMQTETATTCVIAGLLLLDLHAKRGYIATGILTGFALALKASNVLFLAPLALVWCSSRWRQPGFGKGLIKAALATALAGGASYLSAYLISGNPLFPLPFLGLPSPSEMVVANSTYTQPLNWNWLYQLQFLTNKFNESKNGSGGLQWLALLPLLMLLPWTKNRRLSLHAIALLTGSAAFFLMMKYLRYIAPPLMLLSVFLVPGVLALAHEKQWLRRFLAALCISVICVNVLLQRNASWPIYSPILRFAHLIDRQQANQNYLSKHAYLTELLLQLKAQPGPIQPIANIGTALFAGTARGLHWHDPEGVALWQQLQQAPDDAARAQRLDALLERLQPSDIILMDDHSTHAIAPLLDTRAKLVRGRPGAARWWRVPWPVVSPTIQSARSGTISRARRSTQIVHWRARVRCDTGQTVVLHRLEWLSEAVVVAAAKQWVVCDEKGFARIDSKMRSPSAVTGWRYVVEGTIESQRWRALYSNYTENDFRQRLLPWHQVR